MYIYHPRHFAVLYTRALNTHIHSLAKIVLSRDSRSLRLFYLIGDTPSRIVFARDALTVIRMYSVNPRLRYRHRLPMSLQPI